MGGWNHYRIKSNQVASLAMGKQMSFLQEVCRVLGLSLALYSMSYHVATLVWVILQQISMQHRATVRVPGNSMDTGSCIRSISTCDDVSYLLSSGELNRSSDGDDSDFRPTA